MISKAEKQVQQLKGTDWEDQAIKNLAFFSIAKKLLNPDYSVDPEVKDVVDQELVTLPIEEMIANQDLWPADKDAEIVIYCGSGHRSTMAMEMLLSYGYSNVTSLSGGFSGWVVAEYPVADYVAP